MKKLLPWLVVGLLLRFFLMGFSIHPDFRAVNFAGYLIAQKGKVFTFYDYISKLPRDNPLVKLYGDDLFIYPPLAYLVHGISNAVFFNVYPQHAFETLINDYGSLRQIGDYPFLVFLLKIPYLIADGFCLYLLRKIVNDNTRFRISLFWLFNPINLYVTYMIGQFDIFLCVFILAAIAYKKLAPFMLGVAAGFKPFPLFLLPLLPGNKIKNILLGGLTYLAIIVPYLFSPAFKQYALFATLSDKILYAKILVSGSQYLSLFFAVLIVLYWLNFRKPEKLTTNEWFLSVLLLFYSVTHFHPQWFLWAAPLLTLLVAQNRKNIFPVAILITCYVCIVLSFDSSLNVGLFGSTVSIIDILNRFYPADQFISIIRSVLAGTSLAFLLQLGDKTPHS